MQKPVNVLNVNMIKLVQEYNLETGEVGKGISEYSLFNEQIIIPDLQPKTIKSAVLAILDKNCVDYEKVKQGRIFEESRITFQTFEDEDSYTVDKESPYFVDNDIYIEINEGKVTMDELQEIFPELENY